jgi:hypothetical protein
MGDGRWSCTRAPPVWVPSTGRWDPSATRTSCANPLRRPARSAAPQTSASTRARLRWFAMSSHPSDEQLRRARRIFEAMARAHARGEGVAILDGAMVDEMSLRAARRRLAQAANRQTKFRHIRPRNEEAHGHRRGPFRSANVRKERENADNARRSNSAKALQMSRTQQRARTTENRGVGGSSPPLAIANRLQIRPIWRHRRQARWRPKRHTSRILGTASEPPPNSTDSRQGIHDAFRVPAGNDQSSLDQRPRPRVEVRGS